MAPVAILIDTRSRRNKVMAIKAGDPHADLMTSGQDGFGRVENVVP